METVGIIVIVAFIGFVVWRIRKDKNSSSNTGGGAIPRNTPDRNQH